MKRSIHLALVHGLALSLTLGTAVSLRADEEKDGAPQGPQQIEEPADQPETPDTPEKPEEPSEPTETPEPSDTPKPADAPEPGDPQAVPNPPTEVDYDLLNLVPPPADPTETQPTETPEPAPENGQPVAPAPEAAPVEPQATTPQTQTPPASEPQAVACKVVVVDPVARTITVEASGQLHLLKIDRQAKIMKKGKLVTLDNVVSGQEIVVLARTLGDGTIEVVSLAIGPAKNPAQAAGRNSPSGGSYNNPLLNFPFSSFPNPANIGPVVDTTPADPVVTPNN